MSRIVVEDCSVAMRDGTLLATDAVYIDDGTPRPALVMRGPYSRAMVRQSADAIALARLGWTVVVQDVRGRFDSHGVFHPFRDDGHDGSDAIAWVAGQPWCDGRIAGFGGSYLGFTQWLAAAQRPPALRAVAPMAAGADVRGAMVYEGGALRLGLVAPWALTMAATAPQTSPDQAALAGSLSDDWESFVRLPLAGHPLRALFPAFERWLDPDDEAYWNAIDVRRLASRVAIPAFQVAGWYDLFCDDAIAMYCALRKHASNDDATHAQRLVIGPWTHTTMLLPVTAHYDFGPAADGMARGVPGEMLSWLRDAVEAKPLSSGIDVYVMGSGEWRSFPDWPPPANAVRLYLTSGRGANGLHGDGALAGVPGDAASDSFHYDPHDPVPTRGGRVHGPNLPAAGPMDQRPVEERDDVLVYSSEPLAHDLTVIGDVSASIVFATTALSADVTVKLVDVHRDGFAFNVVDSIRRCSFTPGSPQNVEVTLGPTAICFRAGHRIRVEVSSSNFPRFDRNPSTGGAPRDAATFAAARQTVHHGGMRPSFLALPVVV